MGSKVEFYKLATQNRFGFQEFRNQSDRYRAALYLNKAFDIAKSMGIEDLPASRVEFYQLESSDEFYSILFKLEDYLNKIYAENLFDLDPSFKQRNVYLDEDWRAKVSS